MRCKIFMAQGRSLCWNGLTIVPSLLTCIFMKIYENSQINRNIHFVAIGGGTGLSTLLRGLKNYTKNITAIVTVSDDGGSSGRLRKNLGIIPPGDIRNCLVALSASESLMADLFQYRFQDGTGLEGHSFGNLFLV
ncbi:MAG TPA: YvcK family protein, partial [Candidatus Eremiobacteraeota bacterium]|nr:YvcK family protein [Candidatus Eremiobacteraeota bacterium]